MKKKKKLIIISSLIIIILYLIIFEGVGISSNVIVIGKESDIKEVKYYKINNNLYYTDELIELKKESKKEIINDYNVISKYLKNKYPNKDFIIDNLNKAPLAKNKTMVYLLKQMFGDAVLEDSHLHIETTGDIVKEDLDGEYSMTKIYNEQDIDKPNIKITPKEIKKKALSLAKENVDKMNPYFSFIMKIRGTYNLNYKEDKGYYYRVSIAPYSYIDVSTDGDVIESYFFNGQYDCF